MEQNTCAFTGHRPNKFPWRRDESDPRCIALKAVLLKEISALAVSGVTGFFTGGAECVDTWAAELVLDLREQHPSLKLRCVLPYEGQSEGWSDSAQERYRSILARADSVTYVCRAYRDGCLLERNRRLVESAALLLAVFNGTYRSGTGAAIRYARKLNREILLIDARSLSVTREHPTPRQGCAPEEQAGGALF